MNMRDRIRDLFPGDENKEVRHQLYSTPNLLKSDHLTDDQLRSLAGQVPPPESEHPEPEPKVGEIMTPDREAEIVHEKAQALVRTAQPVIVETAEQYQAAAMAFAAIKKMRADNEKKRKELKEPILESGRRLDATFKATDDLLAQEQARYETPMVGFKTREREALQREADARARVIRDEQERLQREADAARADLERAKAEKAKLQEDPFLALIHGEDAESKVQEAYEETRQAIIAVAQVPKKIESDVTPVMAAGTRVSYPWVWEVTDPDLVPRELCSPDPVKINAKVRSLKAANDNIKLLEPIPGLNIHEDVRIGGGR